MFTSLSANLNLGSTEDVLLQQLCHFIYSIGNKFTGQLYLFPVFFKKVNLIFKKLQNETWNGEQLVFLIFTLWC